MSGDIKTGSFQVSGLTDLERLLMDFPDRLAKNVMAGALRAGCAVIRNEAKQKVPVGTKPHVLISKSSKTMKGKGERYMGTWLMPGNLRKSIKVRLAPPKRRTRPLEYWVYVSAKTAWYWKFIEFGTKKMPAQPFMRPAFDNMKEQATEAVRDYLGKRIEKEAAKR